MSDLVERLRTELDRAHDESARLYEQIEELQAKCRLLEADLAFHYGYRQEIERGKLKDTNE